MRGPARAESTVLRVRVQPRAPTTDVVGWVGRSLRVRVAAPPIEGEANRAVIDLLARTLGVPRSAVSLVGGARGRDKLLRIAGISHETVEARLPRKSQG
ncbi:MAG: DUF167 domain-containing protein [Candidatus Methylomirabilia bacterium]